MTLRILLLHENGTIEARNEENSLSALQSLVGGYIEMVPLTVIPGGEGLMVVCNEDGLRLKLKPNLWGAILGRPFVGPLVLKRYKPDGESASITSLDEEAWVKRSPPILRKVLRIPGLSHLIGCDLEELDDAPLDFLRAHGIAPEEPHLRFYSF